MWLSRLSGSLVLGGYLLSRAPNECFSLYMMVVCLCCCWCCCCCSCCCCCCFRVFLCCVNMCFFLDFTQHVHTRSCFGRMALSTIRWRVWGKKPECEWYGDVLDAAQKHEAGQRTKAPRLFSKASSEASDIVARLTCAEGNHMFERRCLLETFAYRRGILASLKTPVVRGEVHSCELCADRSFKERRHLLSHVDRLHCFDKGCRQLMLKHPCRNFLVGARALWNERPALGLWALYSNLPQPGVCCHTPSRPDTPIRNFAALVRHWAREHPALANDDDDVCSKRDDLVPICCPGGTKYVARTSDLAQQSTRISNRPFASH